MRGLGPRRQINLPTLFLELLTHLRHPLRRILGRDEAIRALVLLGGEVAHFLRDLHRAELRAAHAAEMRRLRAFRR